MNLTKPITIFEGPDGAGKTTTAKRYAQLMGARYVHLPSFQGLDDISHLYLEAMLPALMGYQAVVLDRSWLSEKPYGTVLRGGVDRVGVPGRRMLERAAFRCGAVVVKCLPSWDVVNANHSARLGVELVKRSVDLNTVYHLYNGSFTTSLPVAVYDYTTTDEHELFRLASLRSRCHNRDVLSAGNLQAPVVLVGESFARHKPGDALYQLPFVSFGRQGCSWWLAEQLEAAGIDEQHLLWLNADQDLSIIHELPGRRVYALGKAAEEALYREKITATAVEHPMFHKRFRHDHPYPLIDFIIGDLA